MNAIWKSAKTQVKGAKLEARGALCRRSCDKGLQQIRDIKASLLSRYGAALDSQKQILHWALSEAEAVAWQTPYPHLLFPVLAEEKVRAAQRWVARQELVRQAGLTRVLTA